LLQERADIHLKNKQEKSAVQLAQERGHFSWIKEVIPCQILDSQLPKTLALHQAIWAKDHPRIRQLLEQGSEITEKDENGNTAWDYCVMGADVELAEILVDHMDSNGLPKDIGSAAFDTAIAQMTAFDYTDTKTWESTVQICRRLLPFRKAFNNDFEFAKARSPICNYNKTYLIWAAELGRTSEVKFLLECGSDVDAQDSFLETATHYAVGRNNLEIVKLLVQKRANLSLQNRTNKTPLMVAEAFGFTDIKAYLEDVLANRS
jgi:ankyrin repeat protein